MRSLLEAETHFSVVGEGGEHTLDSLPADVDLVVVDVGEDVTRLSRFFNASPDQRCLVLLESAELAGAMLQAGANGVVLRKDAAAELLLAVRQILSGEIYLSKRALSSTVRSLTRGREEEEQSFAGVPILRTKLHRPRIPEDHLSRPRLIAGLEAAQKLPATLVSAPAGFGKSMLVANWLNQTSTVSAWLSLETSESDLRFFIRYLIAALRQHHPECCELTEQLIDRVDLPDLELLSTTLANELDALPGRMALVFDDYHSIATGSPVHQLLDALLQRPPFAVHFVLIGRRDPPLSLLPLRAAGELHEVRMAELAFSNEETREIVARIGGVKLSEDTASLWYEEIEGWPIGVRLLALTLRAAGDSDTYAQFAKSDSGLREHLLGELLGTLDEVTQQWLLETSLLDRFCAPLCDAVCSELSAAGVAAEDTMKQLITQGLPIVELDSEGRWYRYHHAFAHLLTAKLATLVGAERLQTLHRRASAWFEARELIPEAVAHALAVKDEDLAVSIISNRQRRLLGNRRWRVVRDWLDLLPKSVRERSLELVLAQGWILLEEGRLEELTGVLSRLEVLVSSWTGRDLTADLELFRGSQHVLHAEYPIAIEYFKRALDSFLADTPDGLTGLGVVGIVMALTLANDPDAAIRIAKKAIHEAGPRAHSFQAVAIPSGLMHAYLAAGEHEAIRAIAAARGPDFDTFASVGGYRLACSFLMTWEPAQAETTFTEVILRQNELRAMAAIDVHMGRVLLFELQGRHEDADLALLDLRGRCRGVERNWSHVADALDAQLALLRGDFATAYEWAKHAPAGHPLELQVVFARPTLIRLQVLISAGDLSDKREAIVVLDDLADRVSKLHCHKVDVLVLRALAHTSLNERNSAISQIEAAVLEAGPKNMLLPFLLPGPGFTQLIEDLNHGLQPAFADRIIELRRRLSREMVVRQPRSDSVSLPEPLTNRELDILELLVERLQNKEIAARLFVSVETVKSHLKHLYQKLGVRNRREAAALAAQILPAAPKSKDD